MRALYDPTRHEQLGGREWDAGRARDAIAAICRHTEVAFDPRRLWPMHPRDREPDTPEDGIFRGLYLGAAGVVHGLHRLADAGLCSPTLDLEGISGGLLEAATIPDEPGAGASLLVGSTGILLVAQRLTGSDLAIDLLAEAIGANADHPSNELLLGAPGTMLAAQAVYGRGGGERFAELWRASARVLLGRQDGDGLWTQDLYGDRLRYLGAGHGFAGNARALAGAPEWLDDAPGTEADVLCTARAQAIVEGGLASWPALADGSGSRTGQPPRVQWCHGAPGMVISLASLGRGDEQHGALLAAAGELTWRAGPLTANAGLCHGASGNGFAFLYLLERTGDELWLGRARRFAMHALDQVSRWREVDGRGRHSLFTGDLGPALLAAACLEADARFPGIDDL